MGTPEEIEAFANYVNKNLYNAEFRVDWMRNAFTYQTEGSGVFVRLPIEGFGQISDGVMYIGSALGVWLIMTSLKRPSFDGRITNNSLAVHFE